MKESQREVLHAKDLKRKKLEELKSMCKERGLRCSGNKPLLIGRLLAYSATGSADQANKRSVDELYSDFNDALGLKRKTSRHLMELERGKTKSKYNYAVKGERADFRRYNELLFGLPEVTPTLNFIGDSLRPEYDMQTKEQFLNSIALNQLKVQAAAFNAHHYFTEDILLNLHFPQLSILTIRETNISDKGIAVLLTECPKLRVLDIALTKIEGPGLSDLSTKCPLLESIEIYHPLNLEIAMPHLAKCTLLHTIAGVECFDFDDEIISYLVNMPHLENCRVTYNHFDKPTKITDKGIELLRKKLGFDRIDFPADKLLDSISGSDKIEIVEKPPSPVMPSPTITASGTAQSTPVTPSLNRPSTPNTPSSTSPSAPFASFTPSTPSAPATSTPSTTTTSTSTSASITPSTPSTPTSATSATPIANASGTPSSSSTSLEPQFNVRKATLAPKAIKVFDPVGSVTLDNIRRAILLIPALTALDLCAPVCQVENVDRAVMMLAGSSSAPSITRLGFAHQFELSDKAVAAMRAFSSLRELNLSYCTNKNHQYSQLYPQHLMQPSLFSNNPSNNVNDTNPSGRKIAKKSLTVIPPSSSNTASPAISPSIVPPDPLLPSDSSSSSSSLSTQQLLHQRLQQRIQKKQAEETEDIDLNSNPDEHTTPITTPIITPSQESVSTSFSTQTKISEKNTTISKITSPPPPTSDIKMEEVITDIQSTHDEPSKIEVNSPPVPTIASSSLPTPLITAKAIHESSTSWPNMETLYLDGIEFSPFLANSLLANCRNIRNISLNECGSEMDNLLNGDISDEFREFQRIGLRVLHKKK